ncbi:hypothetical protein H4R20_000467 [Coemansia guatemalensis]|uniref:Uncharacterized protein n=1 Tax=Coemansia guatemalensis TaxID=2761395 RepID=A0A9W8HYU4_9FUNG|nr:hypothetical protein H4R20_000467 [Coemansia guatemalensis]
MRVPFFRTKAKDGQSTSSGGASIRSRRKKSSSDGTTVSEAELSPTTTATFGATTPVSTPANIIGGGAAGPQQQLGEMQMFLARIDDFQGEALRLFPENTALGQMLGELRDECQRRVDYISRVSAPPSWMIPPKHHASSSSSTTINNVVSAQNAALANTGPKRGLLPTVSGPTRTRSKSASPANYSNASSASTTSASSSGSSSNGSEANFDYFSRHQRSGTARRGTPASDANSPPSPLMARPLSSTVAHRGGSASDRRRKTAPQSMFISGPTGDSGGSSHAATTRAARASMALGAVDAPRLPRMRTSSVDAFARPHSFFDSPIAATMSSGDINKLASGAQQPLGPKGSHAAIRATSSTAAAASNNSSGANGGSSKPRPQHMPAVAGGRITGDYLLTIRLSGNKLEAAVSASLQTSLVSMHLASVMGLPINSVPPNSRVWSAGGKSWPVIGEVVAMPFACGNMTFTHSFKVVQGNAAANDMTRDIVLGNDFFIGNKGRIKDNRLHLEKLCMPISVPVRQVSASS